MSGAILRFLMVVSVLICSMHIAEPASAHAAGDENAVHLVGDHSHEDSGEQGSKVAHGGHHHCPVAPDLRQTGGAQGAVAVRDPLFAALASRLTSRTPPPLLDPPLA
ncbi:hypothetical protein [Sphingopyxis sp.]|uniref:hypothetical protein n=1 Tax=Sphingopyxis sp. TaxID=1908224 RepID=UPI002D78C3F9|nr:hypothetical protein [Sphingopyxis sp.]HET6526992.1 hypothetical protein [Sphingopyxis sp.]